MTRLANDVVIVTLDGQQFNALADGGRSDWVVADPEGCGHYVIPHHAVARVWVRSLRDPLTGAAV